MCTRNAEENRSTSSMLHLKAYGGAVERVLKEKVGGVKQRDDPGKVRRGRNWQGQRGGRGSGEEGVGWQFSKSESCSGYSCQLPGGNWSASKIPADIRTKEISPLGGNGRGLYDITSLLSSLSSSYSTVPMLCHQISRNFLHRSWQLHFGGILSEWMPAFTSYMDKGVCLWIFRIKEKGNLHMPRSALDQQV